jgi:transcription antitermination protein NusB
MGVRRRARILAFQALFSWEISGSNTAELLRFPWLDGGTGPEYSEDILAFARLLVQGCLENIEAVDNKIKEHLEHWDITRLVKVDLALLRLGCYSLLYQRQIPATVTIDEAVDIAKMFGCDDSYRFINGVLDGIRKSIETA